MIPTELAKAHEKALYDRDYAARRIKDFTDDWVRSQKKIIELEKAIEILKGAD
jgi:hypothetical protein